jgi:hypothetical protein
MLAWFENHEAVIYWIGALSFIMVLVFPFVAAWLIVHIPADYFSHKRRHHARMVPQPLTILRFLFLALKNIVGCLLVVAGIAMLVLPGQGILTMILGISLMNFPGKFRLERWLISHGPTLRLANKLRRHYNRKPFVLSKE